MYILAVRIFFGRSTLQQTQNRPTSDVKMLRIDELAELGCCCFCSICTRFRPHRQPLLTPFFSVHRQRAFPQGEPRQGHRVHARSQESRGLPPRQPCRGLGRVLRVQGAHEDRGQRQDLREELCLHEQGLYVSYFGDCSGIIR